MLKGIWCIWIGRMTKCQHVTSWWSNLISMFLTNCPSQGLTPCYYKKPAGVSYYVTNLISDLYLNFIHTFFKNTRWKPGSLRCMWWIPDIKIKKKKQLVLMQSALVPSPHVLTVTPHPIRTSKNRQQLFLTLNRMAFVWSQTCRKWRGSKTKRRICLHLCFSLLHIQMLHILTNTALHKRAQPVPR